MFKNNWLLDNSQPRTAAPMTLGDLKQVDAPPWRSWRRSATCRVNAQGWMDCKERQKGRGIQQFKDAMLGCAKSRVNWTDTAASLSRLGDE